MSFGGGRGFGLGWLRLFERGLAIIVTFVPEASLVQDRVRCIENAASEVFCFLMVLWTVH